MSRSSRIALAALVVIGAALPAVGAFVPLRHDPRTVAKKLSQGLEVDGAGKLQIDYKALHFNADNFKRASANPKMMDYFNANIWGKLGTAKLGFDLEAGDVKLTPGDYEFGINMTAGEEFSFVDWKATEKLVVPLKVEKDQKAVSYLTVTLMASDEPDMFLLEARCGPYRGTAEIDVPFLSEEHAHPAGNAPAPAPKKQ